MYEQFYHFQSNPFQLTPDERFFFASNSHQKAISYLDYGVAQGEGFVVITGDVGAGKSSLVSHYFPRLDRNRIVASKIVTTQVDPTDAVRLALTGFGVAPKQADKASVLSAFRGFLLKQHKAKRRVLLIVDEAQNLPRATLEELRMLSNLEKDGQPLFQCFLLAQPQFMDILADPNMEQLRQRVIASFHLGAMTSEDTRLYVEHRLRTVGWRGNPLITEDAYDRIHEATQGIPRRVNTLCSRLLLLGALERLHTLDGAKVDEVVDDLAQEVTGMAERPPSAKSGRDAAGTELSSDALASALARLVEVSEEQAQISARIADAMERLVSVMAARGASDKLDDDPAVPTFSVIKTGHRGESGEDGG